MNSVLSAFSPVRNIKQLFVRPPGNFPVLDGFRALSMLMIIVFHTFAIYAMTNAKYHPETQMIDLIEQGGLAWSWAWNADKSVDIFFVISGFLITGILLRQLDREGRIHMWNFYTRRFLRLSPAYWLAILIYIGLNGPNIHYLWTNVLYINNFFPYDKQAMNWTWTLAIEEQFYLIYPILLATLVRITRKPEGWLWGLLGLSFLIRFLVIITHHRIAYTPGSMLVTDPEFHAYHFDVLYDNLYTRYGALLCGCLAAFYYYHHEDATKRFLNTTLGHVLGILSLVCIVALMMTPVLERRFDDWHWMNILYQTFSRNLFAGSLAYLILLCVERSYMSRVLNLIFANRFWYPLAQLSYSMYLLHVLPIVAMVSLGVEAMHNYPKLYPYTNWEAMCLLSLYSAGLTILGALVFYLLIERPIMNLRK